jgi:hypothetical protein
MDKQEKLATWNGYQQVHFIREPDSNGTIKLQKQLCINWKMYSHMFT